MPIALIVNDMSNDIDSTFAVLADPTRRRVVELLSAEPLRASDIAERVGMSRPATSRHLRTLRQRGLVDVSLTDDDGRGRTYALRTGELVALSAWLDQLQAHWSTQPRSFKAHAETTAKVAPARRRTDTSRRTR